MDLQGQIRRKHAGKQSCKWWQLSNSFHVHRFHQLPMCSIVFLSVLPEDAWNPAESAAVEASMSFRTGMLPPNLGGSWKWAAVKPTQRHITLPCTTPTPPKTPIRWHLVLKAGQPVKLHVFFAIRFNRQCRPPPAVQKSTSETQQQQHACPPGERACVEISP